MDYRSIPLKAKPSPPDERDYKITRLVPMTMMFPEEYHRPYIHEVKNQGHIGSCVAHSLAYCREMTEEKQRGKYTKFSPGFIYGDRLDTDYQGEGMEPRMALAFLKNRGVCEYDLFPENDTFPVVNNLLKERWNTVMTNANQYRISSYTFLETVNEIKMGIMAFDSVTIMIPIYNSFYQVTKENPIVPLPTENDTLEGYHEMTLTGWNKNNTWDDLNSWGEEWGDNGYCYLPFDYPIVEAWGMTDNILPDQPYRDEFGAMADSTNYQRTIKSIVIHHPGDGLPPDISIEKRWNPHNYEYPAYDFGVEYDGRVKEGRPLFVLGAHCKADKVPRNGDEYWYNKNAIGVAVAGDFTKFEMPPEQYAGLVKFAKELMAKYNVPINEVKAHRDVAYTLCPGTSWDFNKFKNDLQEVKVDMDNLVIYKDGDVAAALLLSYKLGCPMVLYGLHNKYTAAVKHWIGISGTDNTNNKYYAGSGRIETALEAL